MISFLRWWLAGSLLAITLLSAVPVGAPPGSSAASAWKRLVYGGASPILGAGWGGAPIPSYSFDYPPDWTPHTWPDTLAGFGQIDLWSSSGANISLVLLPLRLHGPKLVDLLTHDAAAMSQPAQDQLTLPLGRAMRLSGRATDAGGRVLEFLYLQRGPIVYRWFFAGPAGSPARGLLTTIAASLHIPATGRQTNTTTPPPPATGICCHCPARGTGWGTVLTRLDGIAVYSNAGNVDNGCSVQYGIAYQCVELVQRYFALRWGYAPIWAGVAAAGDMRGHHPDGIQFIANGGLPGPREGDALLFYGGAFGHVALVERVDRRNGVLDLVEENWSPTGAASLPIFADNTVAIRDSAFGSYSVAGWLHSPRNSVPAVSGR